MVPHFARPADLLDAAALATILGPIVRLESTPLPHASLTGNQLTRLTAHLPNGTTRRLMLKQRRPANNWIARRTGDVTGREARFLGEPALAPIWEAFACPYLAAATADGEEAILMDDLGTAAPQPPDFILGPLRAMHARLVDSAAARIPWLVQPIQRFAIFHPEHLDDDAPVFALARRGWSEARQRLPAPIVDLLWQPPAALASRCDQLPWTVLHGDAKPANFALLSDRRLAAFDWEGVAAGPPALELGYLTAIAGRDFDRDALLDSVPAKERDLAVLAGANVLLWQRALDHSPAGLAEWSWWLRRLERISG